jgi:hypothetical protein
MVLWDQKSRYRPWPNTSIFLATAEKIGTINIKLNHGTTTVTHLLHTDKVVQINNKTKKYSLMFSPSQNIHRACAEPHSSLHLALPFNILASILSSLCLSSYLSLIMRSLNDMNETEV